MRTLTAVPTLVESPFIIVKIGDFTFGNVQKIKAGNTLDVTFPEYMKSVEVVKINGQVNTYTIQLDYPITKGADPNLIDYVLSSVSATRKLTISYGDWNSPSFIYKEEETLITNVSSRLDFNNPKMSYTIQAVSDAKGLQSVNYNFSERDEQPSKIILDELLPNPEYNLAEMFSGMANRNNVIQYGLIATDDKVVHIPSKFNCTIWDYLTYLVGFMIPEGSSDSSVTAKGFYRLSVVDDNKNELGGSYFRISKVSSENNIVIDDTENNSMIDLGSYELDVGFPNNNFVVSFDLENNEEWAILYNTANSINARNYSYKITNDGELKKNYSPSLTRISNWEGTTAADKSWWTSVTQFPLKANLTLKGLVRPTMLMSYVKLNVVFYGQKHISSGYYVILRQTDRIDAGGYRTTLNLLRIKSDTISEKEVTIKNNKTDPATGFNLATNSGGSISYEEQYGSGTYRRFDFDALNYKASQLVDPKKDRSSSSGIHTSNMNNKHINKTFQEIQ